MKKSLIVAPILALLIYSCTALVKPSKTETVIKFVEKERQAEKYDYHASKTKSFNLLHTKLKVNFDWENQYMNGKAELTLMPYFYETSKIDIDAKAMDIKSVSFIDAFGKSQALKFEYDTLQIHITLPRVLTRTDTFKLNIEYVSKPNEFEGKGSKAISDDKGLYFINPLGRDTIKPKQIWTQGETEAASVWFPTLDAPNVKTTQEIYITVKNNFKTLSNGLLIKSTENSNGTRTDHWKQEMPHAPYLFMMAIGEFAVVHDSWDGIAVNYLVEPKDSSEAKNVFGNTPEMLSFYSKILGFRYPWEKYNQIIVSDYVSGAMENTGAVIHGKYVFRTKEQQIDRNFEDVIAHELFHHWFGDLVTCESWSNLPLNESFATYGEYLWIEHKYGEVRADRHLEIDMQGYMSDTPYVDLIRYNYSDRGDMFDGHSYQKGGRILHLLRDYVGDDAFFASLKLYLHQHAFGNVEVHDLRMAFEEVTGQDLNWFFNQWFLDKGHPHLKVDYTIQGDSLLLTVEQIQSKEFPVYKLPVSIDIYENGKAKREHIWVTKEKETFMFNVIDTPEFVNFDAKKKLLGVIEMHKTAEQALFQYTHSDKYKDKLEALLSVRGDTSLAAWDLLDKATNDDFKHFRKIALFMWRSLPEGETEEHKAKLIRAAGEDSASIVRAVSVNILRSDWPNDSSLIPVYKRALEDSSLMVKQYGLYALSAIAREDALLRAYKLETITDPGVITTLADIYSDVKDESKRKWYNWALQQVEAKDKISVLHSYTEYLRIKGNEIVWKACKTLKETAIYENNKAVREAAGIATQRLRVRNIERIKDIRKDIFDQKASSRGKPYDLKIMKGKYKELKAHDERLRLLLEEIYKKEINEEVKKAYRGSGFLTTEAPSDETPAREETETEPRKEEK
jgi:aminopeptidase N